MDQARPFDRTLLRRRRNRAAPRFGGHDFLHARAAGEMAERLSAINRRFRLVLDFGGTAGHAPQLLSDTELYLCADLAHVMAGRADAPTAITADEEHLPFREEAFDLVLSTLTLHSVNDLPGALIQFRRALKPDGLFLSALLGGGTLKALREAFLMAESELEGGAAPRFHPLPDISAMGGLLQRAGFALPVADVDRVTVRYGHPLELMADLRAMGESNMLAARTRKPLKRATLMRACELYAERHGGPDGRIAAHFEILYAAGWAPHESQQKPLRPGSARMRLADALGTVEHTAEGQAADTREGARRPSGKD